MRSVSLFRSKRRAEVEVGDGALGFGEAVCRADAEAEWHTEHADGVHDLATGGQERLRPGCPGVVAAPGVAGVREEREERAVEVQQVRAKGAVRQCSRQAEFERRGPGAPARAGRPFVSPNRKHAPVRAANAEMSPAAARPARDARACPERQHRRGESASGQLHVRPDVAGCVVQRPVIR